MNIPFNQFSTFVDLSQAQPLAFIIALFLSYILTPIIKERAGFTTRKELEAGRCYTSVKDKVKTLSTPRLGGLSILISTALTVVVFIIVYGRFTPAGIKHLELEAIITGSTMIFLIGLLDDIKPLPCITKLLGQISAASITSLLGLKIKFLANPLYYFDHSLSPHIKLDAISSFLITVAFLVLISNAINLIDGIDGLAAGVSVISAVAIWAISLSPLLYRPDAAILAATLAGASLGFLRYNFNPARMFLGDNGSYLLGFVLASLSCLGLAKKITVAIITPLLILIFALPLLDCFYTIIRRSLNKKDILKPDSEHLHHQLENLGLSHKQINYLIYSLSLFCGGLGCFEVGYEIGISYLVIIGSIAAIWLVFSFIFNFKKQRF